MDIQWYIIHDDINPMYMLILKIDMFYGYVYITYVIYILQTERERDGHNIYLRADSSLGQAAVSEVAASAANLQRPRSFRSDDQTFG